MFEAATLACAVLAGVCLLTKLNVWPDGQPSICLRTTWVNGKHCSLSQFAHALNALSTN